MKIAVLVKQVPSSEARIRIASDGRSIDPSEVQFVINPYDEYAMEAALQLKEKFGGEVVAISCGTAKAEEALRTCLALGADRAVLVRDDALPPADSLSTATALAAALKPIQPDLVLCGKSSIDLEGSAVGIQTAELCGLPHVAVVSKIEPISEKEFTVHREIEGGAEEWVVTLPAVLTANKGLNEPRYASLKGIMAAKKKPLEVFDLAALGLSAAALPATPVEAVRLEYPPVRAEGKIFKGEAAEAARQLVQELRDTAKVI